MELKLPNSIGGKRDLILAMRQVEQILSDRLQDEVRQKFGAKKVGTKVGQQMLSEILEENKLKDDTATLKKMMQQLEGFKQHAPQIRVAFAQEPDQDLYKRIVSWFRTEIHPGVLVQIGVQPTIGGGFVLTTPLRRYDFSLKTRILNSTPKFLEVLHRGEKKEAASAAPAPVPEPTATPEPATDPALQPAEPEVAESAEPTEEAAAPEPAEQTEQADVAAIPADQPAPLTADPNEEPSVKIKGAE